MKRVCVIGHFAKGKELLNGQTVKTKIVTKEIIKTLGKNEVSCMDTCGGIRALRYVPRQCINALKHHKNVIIMPAENGLRVFAPILVVLNTFFHRKLHYVVIGGWISQFLQKKKVLSFFLKKFDALYVETDSMKIALQKEGFNNIIVVPNCKELIILKPEELVCENSEPFKLCTFSRVMKEKGIEIAVNAVKKINAAENREIFTLDIYGQIDDNQIDWFNSLQKSFPEYIQYKGRVSFDKSTEVLKQYYALLFPTFYEGEGFAGTLIDAMAAGVPVIASDWKYNSEIIQDGTTGMIIKNNLQDSLYEIKENVDLWKRMKRNCLDAASHYLPSKALEPLITNMMK